MSLQWTFITLEIQYLVLMREAWYSSWSQSNRAECVQGHTALQHRRQLSVLETEDILDYLKTNTPPKAISGWINSLD